MNIKPISCFKSELGQLICISTMSAQSGLVESISYSASLIGCCIITTSADLNNSMGAVYGCLAIKIIVCFVPPSRSFLNDLTCQITASFAVRGLK